MKNIVKSIGLITLICFSFFYTEKVIDVVSEQDDIMIKIKEVKDNYKIDSVDATISENTIIPGINGREVDIDKSYQNMKQIGIFNENYFVYKEVSPKDKLEDNYDKYIINGNLTKKYISLIFIVNSNRDLENILNNIDNKVILNLFIDYEVLLNNLDKLKKTNYNIYSYGKNGNYDNDNLKLSNNVIERNFNKSLYCIENENNALKVCSNNKMHTVEGIYLSNAYNEIKKILNKNNIIVINNDYKNIKEFNYLINYINSKGYKIASLENLLSENLL